MCQDKGRLEVHYGVQEYTGVQTWSCRLSEQKIQEIRDAKVEDVQDILRGIVVVWNK